MAVTARGTCEEEDQGHTPEKHLNFRGGGKSQEMSEGAGKYETDIFHFLKFESFVLFRKKKCTFEFQELCILLNCSMIGTGFLSNLI